MTNLVNYNLMSVKNVISLVFITRIVSLSTMSLKKADSIRAVLFGDLINMKFFSFRSDGYKYVFMS